MSGLLLETLGIRALAKPHGLWTATALPMASAHNALLLKYLKNHRGRGKKGGGVIKEHVYGTHGQSQMELGLRVGVGVGGG